MFLVGLLNWWYGEGWRLQMRRARGYLLGTAGFFSLGQLLTTLFAPFRQISAGQVNGPVGVQFRAFLDRTFSRVFGAVFRSIFIIIGSLTLALILIYSVVIIVFWLIVPVLPVVGLIMTAIGWMPAWK